jgi:hypothetical protein
MGLLNKVFSGFTILLCIVSVILTIFVKAQKKMLIEKEAVIFELNVLIKSEITKNTIDSLNRNNLIREIQSVMQQVNIENKSLKKENSDLRKGVRLDLIKIRVRRNGKIIDSTFTQAYKYLNK